MSTPKKTAAPLAFMRDHSAARAINPLIEDHVHDTIGAVNSVLDFIAGWGYSSSGGASALPFELSGTGLAMVIKTCQAALTYHVKNDTSEGGE